MQQVLENLQIYALGIWRFRWYSLAFTWLISLGGWAVLFKVPDVYEATATVYVDTDSMLRPLLRGLTVEIDIAEKLGLMTKRLFSRPNLERVAKMIGLYKDTASPAEISKILTDLQRNTNLGEMRATRHKQGIYPPDLYEIGVRDDDPQQAKRLVEAFLKTFIEHTVEDQDSSTEKAKQFLDKQIKEYVNRLTDAENRLREFKRDNIDMLPQQELTYIQKLQEARANLENVELELREADFRRNETKQQLRHTPEGQRSVGLDGTPVITPTEERLFGQQSRLSELEARFTDRHPDIKEARRTIAELEEQVRREREFDPEGDPALGTTPNPLHQQINLNLAQIKTEVAALKVRKEAYSARVDNLQRQMDILPKVEAELQRLNRDYEVYSSQYDKLVTRRESAKISEEVEQSGEGFKFKVIDPPRLPIRPIAPNRLMLTSAVLMVGLAGGFGLGFLLSQLRPVIFGKRMLEEVSGLPVFGTVSRVSTTRERVHGRLGVTAFLFAGALLLPVFAVTLYLQVTGKELTSLLDTVSKYV